MTATDELHGQLDTGYPHTLRPELHKALKVRGIDYWVVQGITFWNRDDGCECLAYGYQADGVPKLAIKVVGFTDPEQAIAATLGSDNSDTVKHLMKLQGGHYSWPMLYEAVTGDPFDYDCSPSKSEEVFIEKLISIVGGRKVVDE